MLLAKRDDSVMSGGLQETGAFTIKAGPKAFDILSSNLYQNKILAVIREISCNAADAHKMVGRPLSEIVVQMPNIADPVFSVRDFGPSMSHSQIMRLYTSYFDSTKDGDNDAIGGFGLGSKSPFSVTDQFTVRAWQDGNLRTYAMYKVDGVPTVSLISSEPSSEPTGIEVSMTVDTTSLSVWAKEANNYFRWWPTLPTIKRLSSVPAPIFSSRNYASVSATMRPDGLPNWVVLNTVDYAHSGPVVFMGLVPYSLNLTALSKLDADAVDLFQGLPLVLVYDVGAVEISPSRETLSYTQATSQRLLATLKDVARNLLTGYRARIDKCATLYEARQLLWGPESSSFLPNPKLREMFRKANPVWRGTPIPASLKFKLNFLPNPDSTDPAKPNYPISVTTYRRSYYGKSWRRDGSAETEAYVCRQTDYNDRSSTRLVHIDYITSKTYAKLQHALATDPKFSGVRSFEIVSGVPYATLAPLWEEAGLQPMIDMTTLADPPAAPPGTSTRSVTRGYEAAVNSLGSVSSSASFRWHDFTRTEEQLDLTGGGLYVEFFDGQPTTSLYALRDYASGGFFLAHTRLIGIPRRFLNTKKTTDLLTKHGWVNVTEVASVLALLNQSKIVDTFNVLHCRRAVNASILRSNYIEALVTSPVASNFPNLLTLHSKYLKPLAPKLRGGAIVTSFDFSLLPAATQAEIKAAQVEIQAAADELDALEIRKPLLKYISPAPSLDMAAVLDYIRS